MHARDSNKSAVKKHGLALLAPGLLLRRGERLEVGWRRRRIVDPLAQCLAAVDEIDRQAVTLVLVREVAPQRVVVLEAAQRLERAGHETPWTEFFGAVKRLLGVHLQAGAQLADVLVKGGLEPALAQHAAAQPLRRQRAQRAREQARVDVRRT